MPAVHRIRFVDSHTGGEPTRLVLAGGPDLGVGPLGERVARFREKFDAWRTAIVNEPRGSDTVVGALLVPPERAGCQFGVIFFNNAGPLGMCGHGTIGVVASLAHLGQLAPGVVRLDTPVGAVDAELHANGEVSVTNVASYRKAKGVVVTVPGLGPVTGDVAWGGNWFFLVEQHDQEIELSNLEKLTDVTRRIRSALNAHGFPEVDHVELFGPSTAGKDSGAATPSSRSGVDSRMDSQPLAWRSQLLSKRDGSVAAPALRVRANSRNFVLCPGDAYDRSPCGTGTSAKLACLAADGKLAEGVEWIQESVIGSTFRARYRWLD
ncbi:MAG: Hydroxyproline-2-epimerase, partial [Verrucomicrobia bacterium]|nr:Hydroxyproline-2-epimerase [Verrucomicrobiota bacterium]